MATEHQERVRIEDNDGFQRRQKVVKYAPSTRVVLLSRINKFIWLVTGVINILIAIRFVLKAMAANPGNAFADLIYGITDILVAPFVGLISTPVAQNGSMLDVASIFAIVVYSIVAFVIVQLLRILFASSGGTRQVKTVERVDDI